MGKRAILEIPVYYGGYNIASDLSEISFPLTQETPEETTLDKRSHYFSAKGLQGVSATHSGYVDPEGNDIDAIMHGDIGGGADRVFSFAPTGGADGELAYSMLCREGQYSKAGKIGGMLGITGKFYNRSDREIRGTILLTGAKTSSGNGTARQLGAVSSSQHLRAAAHVIAISGGDPSVVFKVQSDDAEGFADPTDRITFDAFTAIGSQWPDKVAGAITDDWWRINYALSGGTTSVTAVIIVGIF